MVSNPCKWSPQAAVYAIGIISWFISLLLMAYFLVLFLHCAYLYGQGIHLMSVPNNDSKILYDLKRIAQLAMQPIAKRCNKEDMPEYSNDSSVFQTQKTRRFLPTDLKQHIKRHVEKLSLSENTTGRVKGYRKDWNRFQMSRSPVLGNSHFQISYMRNFFQFISQELVGEQDGAESRRKVLTTNGQVPSLGMTYGWTTTTDNHEKYLSTIAPKRVRRGVSYTTNTQIKTSAIVWPSFPDGPVLDPRETALLVCTKAQAEARREIKRHTNLELASYGRVHMGLMILDLTMVILNALWCIASYFLIVGARRWSRVYMVGWICMSGWCIYGSITWSVCHHILEYGDKYYSGLMLIVSIILGLLLIVFHIVAMIIVTRFFRKIFMEERRQPRDPAEFKH